MTIRVERPGMLTTIQDLGRPGYQHLGVTVGGAMDDVALRAGNALVGNSMDAAAIEVTLLGPQLQFTESRLAVVTGADLDARLDGAAIEPWQPFFATAGSTLSFGSRRSGCRACVCVAGGIDLPLTLGGRGTDLTAGFGGMRGRRLVAGDELPLGRASTRNGIGNGTPVAGDEPGGGSAQGHQGRLLEVPTHARSFLDRLASTAYGHDAPVVRITAAPESGLLSPESGQTLVATGFKVSPDSNRMGYRIIGAALALERAAEMVSAPVALGTVQLPPGGEPIVLMADRQTTGGYPRIANVIAADICRLAQLAPGDIFHFQYVSHDEARRRLAEQNELIASLAKAMGAE
jgi:antagonist of KipI